MRDTKEVGLANSFEPAGVVQSHAGRGADQPSVFCLTGRLVHPPLHQLLADAFAVMRRIYAEEGEI